MIVVSNKVKELSNEIVVRAMAEANYLPIDRYFLEKYLEEILSVNRLEFIYCNLERVNNTYSVLLMACLPELWEDITYDDVDELLSSFTNVFSFYALLIFAYKYLEVDLIDHILNFKKLSKEYKKDIIKYIKSQYPNFYKSEVDYFMVNEGQVGVDFEKWSYIKQRVLSQGRFKPSELFDRLQEYIENLSSD